MHDYTHETGTLSIYMSCKKAGVLQSFTFNLYINIYTYDCVASTFLRDLWLSYLKELIFLSLK